MKRFIIYFIITCIILSIFRPIIIQGDSMNPTLEDRQILLSCSLIEPEIGDIVIVDSSSFLNEECIIKRITDIQGNTVFLQGDNTEHSLDSREFGYIDKDLIISVLLY